ncbi:MULTISPECIES: 2'-5' RNA ligase family protein [Clostridium]|uniref:2'-5' RNA ligase family protein n=1 Tax=Clostridium cibarium TaxID=2762247 RepID=A0ABR8PZ06_9CLOT|nr:MULTISPECIES: 2'-5' RNA ligase family protein [Clostridium]MBD7913400.1 2'-5' RNA ligase family protein [Clostridium cibarium]
MRYVVVSLVKGEAGKFNNDLRKEVWQRFKAKSSKLPAHFTIKAPFEYCGDISLLENVLEKFCEKEKAQKYEIDGYGHFNERVIYMNVNMSKEGKALHDRLISEMSLIPYIKFDKKDGKNKIFHVTIASKNLGPIYDKVWGYVNENLCDFNDCYFDNIVIYKWEDNTWKVFKEYNLKLL